MHDSSPLVKDMKCLWNIVKPNIDHEKGLHLVAETRLDVSNIYKTKLIIVKYQYVSKCGFSLNTTN